MITQAVFQAPCARRTPSLYRLTSRGLAVAAWEQQGSRTRHVVDLLQLLQSSIPGLPETQLRGFMPAESLTRAIAVLLEMGLIESREMPPAIRPAVPPRRSAHGLVSPGAGR